MIDCADGHLIQLETHYTVKNHHKHLRVRLIWSFISCCMRDQKVRNCSNFLYCFIRHNLQYFNYVSLEHHAWKQFFSQKASFPMNYISLQKHNKLCGGLLYLNPKWKIKILKRIMKEVSKARDPQFLSVSCRPFYHYMIMLS